MEQEIIDDWSTSLGLLRQQIAAVDQQILMLLAERQRLVLQVGHCKLRHQIPLYDPYREQQLLQTLLTLGQQQQLATEHITELFQIIFRHSLELQQQLSIAPSPAGEDKVIPSKKDEQATSPCPTLSPAKRTN
jgi:chorismate mutase